MLLNDDSVVDPGYVERITEALDPGAEVVMAAGVMRDATRAISSTPPGSCSIAPCSPTTI